MYAHLGLKTEDKAEGKRREDACRGGTSNLEQSLDFDLGDHLIDHECEDYIPHEKMVVYDRMILQCNQVACFLT